MPKTRLEFGDRPLLDIVSLGRAGPKGSLRLSADQIALIERTVRRTPEVMVKVLPKDGNTLRSVRRHFSYIGRDGNLELETDDGDRIQGKDVGQRLLENWDLDLDEYRKQTALAPVSGRSPKLVHKIVLSMPPGTSAKGVLDAARDFAREQFALKHRYALVLHTDEPHPHVHLVVKAVSEQNVRLHINPATLREWRWEFARHLREQGIVANATARAVRGEIRTHKADGVYRAACRGGSTQMRARTESVAAELRKGTLHVEPGKSKLVETRRAVEGGWRAVGDLLLSHGNADLAVQIRRFLAEMPQPLTERQQLAKLLEGQLRDRQMFDPSRVR